MLEGTSYSQPQPTSAAILHRITSLLVEERQSEQMAAQSQMQGVMVYAQRQIDDAKAQQDAVEEKLALANQRIGYLEALLDEMYTKSPSLASKESDSETAIRVAFTTLAASSFSNEEVEDTTHLFMARWIPLINELGSTVILPNALWSSPVIDSVIQMCLNNVLHYKAQIEGQERTIQYLLANPPGYGDN
ncbi:hypothetical protein CPB83DRAFT_908022 [Crepidotus variabilis]|uniref:Uncharacterized protein n=1 Tax=Crepidotus variabilis TaxID=179855 RepID=A0A9P6JNV4_9AGAR|nr:hypothetical protein CPB83DRAFT_908022 [Crepidotus variabilis]